MIITGETAKKENARRISEQVSRFAGDFVVATAGGKLESVIAGKGGQVHPVIRRIIIARLRILMLAAEQPTSGIFNNGKAIDSCCINVGGRLLQIGRDDGRVTNIAEPMKAVIRDCGLNIKLNDKVELRDLDTLCKRMAKVAFEHLDSKKSQQPGE